MKRHSIRRISKSRRSSATNEKNIGLLIVHELLNSVINATVKDSRNESETEKKIHKEKRHSGGIGLTIESKKKEGKEINTDHLVQNDKKFDKEKQSHSSSNISSEISTLSSSQEGNVINNRTSKSDSRNVKEGEIERQASEFENIESEEIVIQTIYYKGARELAVTFEEPKLKTKDDEERTVTSFESECREEPIPPTPAESCHEYQQTEKETVSEDELETCTDTVTVVFRTDANNTTTSIFKINKKIIGVKKILSKIFKVDVEDFKLLHNDNECDDLIPLSALGVEPFGSIELKIQSTDPDSVIPPCLFQKYEPVISKINVKTPDDNVIIVTIENQCFVKEWLGGYKNRKTNIEYHHASVQTLPRVRSKKVLTRDTQTPNFPIREGGLDTGAVKATQTWRTGLFIPNENDRIVRTDPERFISRNLVVEVIEKMVAIVTIQRFYRAYRKKKLQKEIDEFDNLCRKNARKEQQKRNKAVYSGNKRLILGTTFPVDRNDFYKIYLAIGKWWNKEVDEIQRTTLEECKQTAFSDLLQRETTLIWAVERQRIETKKENLMKQGMRFIEASSQPIVFRNNEGIMSSIDTLETQQAREYQELLSTFLNTNVTRAQRIDTLLTLMRLVKHFDYDECTDEIIDLLQREIDLINLGMSSEQLKPLRERVRDLFMFTLRKYVVNPRGSKYKSPKHPKTDNTYYQCKHCLKHKLASEFNVHVKMTKFDTCCSCQWLNNIGHQRIDLSPFARLLADVRETEMNNCCYSGVCYILQVVGMHYLTTHIWSAESVMSHYKNLDELRFVRFRKHQDWSPWNCILLTLDESFAHLNIDDVDTFYDKFFIDSIKWKHMRAKNHFLPLILNDEFMTKSGLWNDIRDSGKFIHPTHINKFTKPDDFEAGD